MTVGRALHSVVLLFATILKQFHITFHLLPLALTLHFSCINLSQGPSFHPIQSGLFCFYVPYSQYLSFVHNHRPLILVMSEGVHFDAPSHFLVPVEVPVEAPAEVPAEAPAVPVAVAVISAALAAVLRRPRNGSP